VATAQCRPCHTSRHVPAGAVCSSSQPPGGGPDHPLSGLLPELATPTRLLTGLNKRAENMIGELDYDSSLAAYSELQTGFWMELKKNQGLPLMHQCFWDLRNPDDLALRHAAAQVFGSRRVQISACAVTCSVYCCHEQWSQPKPGFVDGGALPLLTLLHCIYCLGSWVFGLHRSTYVQASQDKSHVRLNGSKQSYTFDDNSLAKPRGIV